MPLLSILLVTFAINFLCGNLIVAPLELLPKLLTPLCHWGLLLAIGLGLSWCLGD